MGASLAATCRGKRLWCSTGRTAATRKRAEAAGLTAVDTLDELVGESDVIIVVCPPAAAIDVADAVARIGFAGIYVDVNAIAPATARMIGQRFPRFVDGGVVGPPVATAGSTRLYVSGDEAVAIADLWTGSPLDVKVVAGGAGAASAVKICYAAWTKGSAALLLAIRALATAEDIDATLLDEWATSIPDLPERSERSATSNAAKAWRFAGEMDEIADSFAAHHLPDGFGRAAAQVYGRLSRFKDLDDIPSSDVIAALLEAGRTSPTDG
jgi:3-hydroxyisobutyrate dehydrogenase-like beta-hydroxyacid dehydrogenase